MDTPRTATTAPDLATSILEVVARVPTSHEQPAADPAARVRVLTARAVRTTAALSAAAALPPGPIGWMTLLPELVAIWRIQARLVADVAAAYGRPQAATREVLLHCLFAHSIERPLGGFVVRVGERMLVRTASYRALQPVARSIAARLSRRTIGRGIARFVPVVGSVAVAAWAWRETTQVAHNAIEVFSREVEFRPAGSAPGEGAEAMPDPTTGADGTPQAFDDQPRSAA
jgi:uncharacterized protein (DUF697 family)